MKRICVLLIVLGLTWQSFCEATVLTRPGHGDQLSKAAEHDKVDFLPGWGEPDGLYSG